MTPQPDLTDYLYSFIQESGGRGVCDFFPLGDYRFPSEFDYFGDSPVLIEDDRGDWHITYWFRFDDADDPEPYQDHFFLSAIATRERFTKKRAEVPTSIVQAFLKHSPLTKKVHPDQFYIASDLAPEPVRVMPENLNKVLDGFANDFSIFEIELLVAFFASMDSATRLAEFDSRNAFAASANGGSMNGLRRYKEDLVRLTTQPRNFLYNSKQKTYLLHATPLEMTDDPEKKCIRVAMGQAMYLKNAVSWKYVIVGMRSFLSEHGVKRVDEFHAKLYLYLVTQAKVNKQTVFVDTLLANVGKAEAFKKEKQKVLSKIENAILAFEYAGLIGEPIFSFDKPRLSIELRTNPVFFL